MPLEHVAPSLPTVTIGGNAPPAAAAPAPNSGTNVSKLPEAAPVDTTVDPKSLAHVTRLSKELRETKAKNAALEAAQAEALAKVASTPAEVAAKTARLERIDAAKGKPLELLKELGLEFEAIVQAQLDADPEAKASPETVKALQEIEALKAKDKAREDAEADAKRARDAEGAKAANERASKWIDTRMKADPTRWALCARADGNGVDENAVQLAFDATAKKAAQIAAEKKAADGSDWKPTQAEAEALVDEALDLIEAHLAEKGKRYGGQAAPAVPRSRHAGLTVSSSDIDEPTARPAVTIDGDRGATRTLTKSRTQMTAREARDRLQKALRE